MGLIRVSAPMSLGLRVLPAVLSQFATLYPQTHVALSLSDGFVDIVEGDYDLAIRVSGPPDDKSTSWRKICLVPRALMASPAYLTAQAAPEARGDLVNQSVSAIAPMPARRSGSFPAARPAAAIALPDGSVLITAT